MAITKDKIKEYKQRAEELVAQMTLEEKVSQMLHAAPAIERLGIKKYNWWNEALHGVARAGTATVFPQAIGLAATFDEDLLEEIGDAVSTEARAKYNVQQKYGDFDIYKGLTFWSPNVNIFRDPRWGRGHETYGEDPYLTGRLGVRFVNGLQGNDEEHLKVAACAKHFAVHSGPESLRHTFDAKATEQDMRETYLPAFEALVREAKVEAVMGAYNRTNGEPCCGSKRLLKEILREEWEFDGHVVSDCWAIRDFHVHHMITDGPVDSVSLAVSNGCDVNCGSMFHYLTEAVKEGKIEEKLIDKAVTRLFTTRMKLGCMEGQSTVYDNIPYSVVDSDEMKAFNLKVAKKSLVLLKNENGILPLDKSKINTIGVIGPNADNRRALVGNYEGTASRYVTVLEGLEDYLKDEVRVLYSSGCHLYKNKTSNLTEENDRISEVKAVCAESDVVVVCLGLDAGIEGEEGDTGNEYSSGDKKHLDLPGLQNEVLKTAHASGKPVILVLLSGSALAVNFAEENVPAIIQGWYPGAQGGKAIAELIFGEFSPEGKLPVTFYKTTEELPDFTDYSMKNRTYRYMSQDALYPFGFGLSYTKFEFGGLGVANDGALQKGEEVKVSVSVKNTGNFDSMCTVQLYIKAEKPGTPNPQLKAIQKVWLAAGEEKEVTFTLGADAFVLYDEAGNKQIYDCDYTIYAGDSQPDKRSAELMGRKCLKKSLRFDR